MCPKHIPFKNTLSIQRLHAPVYSLLRLPHPSTPTRRNMRMLSSSKWILALYVYIFHNIPAGVQGITKHKRGEMQKPKANPVSRFSGCCVYLCTYVYMKRQSYFTILNRSQLLSILWQSVAAGSSRTKAGSVFSLVMRHQSSVLSYNDLPGICNISACVCVWVWVIYLFIHIYSKCSVKLEMYKLCLAICYGTFVRLNCK